VSEPHALMQRLRQSLSLLTGGGGAVQAGTPQGLPVNLGGYEFAKSTKK